MKEWLRHLFSDRYLLLCLHSQKNELNAHNKLSNRPKDARADMDHTNSTEDIIVSSWVMSVPNADAVYIEFTVSTVARPVVEL